MNYNFYHGNCSDCVLICFENSAKKYISFDEAERILNDVEECGKIFSIYTADIKKLASYRARLEYNKRTFPRCNQLHQLL